MNTEERYEGDLINGMRNGQGKLYYKNGNIKYEGEFANDKFEGTGKFYYTDGNYYIGQFKNGLKHGKGIEYYKNGKKNTKVLMQMIKKKEKEKDMTLMGIIV